MGKSPEQIDNELYRVIEVSGGFLHRAAQEMSFVEMKAELMHCALAGAFKYFDSSSLTGPLRCAEYYIMCKTGSDPWTSDNVSNQDKAARYLAMIQEHYPDGYKPKSIKNAKFSVQYPGFVTIYNYEAAKRLLIEYLMWVQGDVVRRQRVTPPEQYRDAWMVCVDMDMFMRDNHGTERIRYPFVTVHEGIAQMLALLQEHYPDG